MRATLARYILIIMMKQFTTLFAVGAAILLLSGVARAQYSDKSFELKKLSDLYDLRGYRDGKSISVDGNLAVSEANGNVSYSYPIASYSINGFPFQASLNYVGSVGVTAFKTYTIARDVPWPYEHEISPYMGWSKFHQNRPLWILGAAGFAVQVLGTSTHFTPPRGSRVFNAANRTFDDSDVLFSVDGYDFSNRMSDFGADLSEEAIGNTFVDNIRLLRDDGSILELVNANARNATIADQRPELYSGYYFPMEANAPGYAVVSFDSTIWPERIRYHSEVVNIFENQRGPLVPRIVRYYPGSGLEYIFRERLAPFGFRAYFGYDSATGGMYGGPTMFYLEEINACTGNLLLFHRTRHYPICPYLDVGVLHDSTRGRALVSQFGDVRIDYGINSMTIQALGRTTQVKFGLVKPNGVATETNWMPIASNGYLADRCRDMANDTDVAAHLYKGYTGYVTEIVDPEGRKTTFEYEPYTRKYINNGFPFDVPAPQEVTLTLSNHRLKKVTEPGASYRVYYYKKAPDPGYGSDALYVSDGSDTLTVRPEDNTTKELHRLSNVAAKVEKRDRSGALLTTERYQPFYANGTTFPSMSNHIVVDEVTHDTTTRTRFYKRFVLPNFAPRMPTPQYTATYRVETTTRDLTTVDETRYSSNTNTVTLNVFGSSYTVSSSRWGTPFLILDTAHTSLVAGIAKAGDIIDYTVDTVRRYGTDNALAGLFGKEVTQSVRKILNPANSAVLLTQTTDYQHLPLVDTAGQEVTRFLRKLDTYKAWDSLKALGEVDPALGYEYALTDPRTVRYNYDTSRWRVTIPPLFGLARRSVLRDGSGSYLAGDVKEYHTTYDVNNQSSYVHRGLLLRDSVIGTGGVKSILVGAYDYEHELYDQSRIISDARNTLGALALSSPAYTFPATAAGLGDPKPQGSVLDNRDSIRSRSLLGSVYGNMTGEPLAERRLVRRGTPGGGLDTMTLTEFSERTFFGLVAGAVDYNGWYSGFLYDKNGRLRTAWLPYDFQSADSIWLRDEEGTDSSESYGSSRYTVWHGVVLCTPPPPDSLPPAIWIETINRYGKLYADMPVSPPEPSCPPCNGAQEKGSDRTILARCTDPIYYDVQNPATGSVAFQVMPPLTKAILRLDSAHVRLFVSSVIGTCVNFVVDIPALGISKTYVLNCGVPGGGGGDTLWPEGNYLTVDLTSARSTLQSYAPGQAITVNISVTTSGGRVECVSGYESSDLRPQLLLKGKFRRINHLSDNTLAYSYDDNALTAEIAAKVDDYRHTANMFDPAALMGDVRRSRGKHSFGADGRVLKSEATIIEPWGTRIDSVRHAYAGLGTRLKTIDQEGDSVVVKYDAEDRPIEVKNEDGTRKTFSYRYDRPASFGITDQDFFGFVMETSSIDENGTKNVRYTDAFDRLRREIQDVGAGPHRNLMTRYDYDLQGRLTLVINPRGDSTFYWYDEFGRTKKKRHPDLNVVSYAYDDVGNVRFMQSQEQANAQRLTFHQYDDLNRLTIVGEANFLQGYDEDSIDVTHAQPSQQTKLREASILSGVPEPETWRYTDKLDPRYLHDNYLSPALTVNTTLWLPPVRPVPQVLATYKFKGCQLPASTFLGETEPPQGPFIVRPAVMHDCGPVPKADTFNFEDHSLFPEFVRIGVHYDTLPPSVGPVWGGFPGYWLWDMLAPKRTVRNLKGREAAVAYRERSCEPYHFAVMSYDERGRVEALLRFTENLGFDAVYYRYNSSNQIISIRVADLNQQFTTWYGYDANGRVDSVWTALEGPGSGLLDPTTGIFRHPPVSMRPPDGIPADIAYRYTKTGVLDSMMYPQVDVLVDFAYNRRTWLDSIVATESGASLFRQALKYDPTGQIIEQQWQQGAGTRMKQTYLYDSLQQLIRWTHGQAGGSMSIPADTTSYSYDNAGNRSTAFIKPAFGNLTPEAYTYPTRANRLLSKGEYVVGGTNLSNFWYSFDGSAIRKGKSFDSLQGGVRSLGVEDYGWSYRELAQRFITYDGSFTMQEDWRYRPNAMGEREQKRAYQVPAGSGPYLPWVYYQLGGNRWQHVKYHGQQTSVPQCNDTGTRVYLYPVEYLTHGVGYTGVHEDVSQLVTKPDGTKEYRVHDHLASLRASVDPAGTKWYDYDPWGELLASATGQPARRGFNENEEDRESGQLNLGVRKYEPENGARFLSIDPLWEKERGSNPYHYTGNNPLRYVDPTGKQRTPIMGNVGVMTMYDKPALDGGIRGGGGTGGEIFLVPLILLSSSLEKSAEAPVYAPGASSSGASAGSATGSSVIAAKAAQSVGAGATGAGSTPGVNVVHSDNNRRKEQVVGHVNVIIEHLRRLEGTDASHGDPNDPQNRNDWKGDIKKALHNIKDKLAKLRKPFEQILKEKGWSKEKIADLTKRLRDQGFDIPTPSK